MILLPENLLFMRRRRNSCKKYNSSARQFFAGNTANCELIMGILVPCFLLYSKAKKRRTKTMAKRKTFYVPAAIFEGGHSAYAVAVYAYLCFCCDKSGVCFPGMETIAEKCGIARSTARNAIEELERSGLIRSEATHQTSRSGKIRRGTNRYRLTEAPVSNVKPTSCDGAPSAVSRCTPPP